MLLSRRCFSIPMEFSPRGILLIYLIADLNKNFIIHSLASILHVHNFTYRGLFAPKSKLFSNRCCRSFIIFEKRPLFQKKKKKRSFYINVYKKDIAPFDLDDDFSIYFSRSLHRATLRNIWYLMLYRKVINLKKS